MKVEFDLNGVAKIRKGYSIHRQDYSDIGKGVKFLVAYSKEDNPLAPGGDEGMPNTVTRGLANTVVRALALIDKLCGDVKPDPRVDYWFTPPFKAVVENDEVHVVDTDHRYVCSYATHTQVPLSDTEALSEEVQRWFDFAEWQVERMNT